jgi:hypothetical protein
MQTPLVMAFNAEADVPPYTIVKAGASGGVVPAAAATDKVLGVSTDVDSPLNSTADVQFDGIVFVKAGGTVAQGDLLTSDASGHAVTAAPSAGTNNRLAGIALEAAVSGDVFRMLIQPGSLQG